MVLFAIMVLYVKIKLIYSSSTYRFKSNLDRSLPIVNLFCFCMILPGKFFPRKYLYFRLPLIKCLFHSKRINFASNKFLLYLIDNSDSECVRFRLNEIHSQYLSLLKFIHNIFYYLTDVSNQSATKSPRDPAPTICLVHDNAP